MASPHSPALPDGASDFADVLILGAGIGGLAAAASLRGAGLRVTVLEARDRIGGRLHTVPIGGGASNLPQASPGPAYPVDMGGAWVHGVGSPTAPNHLYTLANQLGLGCCPTDYSDAVVYGANGMRLPAGTVADMEQLYQGFEQHCHSLLHAADPRLALLPIRAAMDAFSSERRLTPAQHAQLTFSVSNHMEHYWAGEAHSMGVAALEEDVLPGGDVVLAAGYGGIVRQLAAGLDVRLGHEALAVQYDGLPGGGGGGGVTVTARISAAEGPAGAAAAAAAAGGGVAVRQFRARAVVVTLPLGVLRSGAVAFSPPLEAADPRKAAAIGRLGVAVYNKVVMLFEPADVFWDDSAFIYRIPAPHEAGRWSYFLNLKKVTGAPILVGFNLGQAAAALEAASDEATVASALEALAGLYGAAAVRRPRQALVTRWGSDPHSRMSYTYIPAGLTGAAFDDLRRPVAGRLFFAGEATHRRHYGTAHGAYDSGRQAAEAVAAQLRPLLQQRQPLRLWQGRTHELRQQLQRQWSQPEPRQLQQERGQQSAQAWWPAGWWARPPAAEAAAVAAAADGVRRRRRSAQPTPVAQGRLAAAAAAAVARGVASSGPPAGALYGSGVSVVAGLYGGGSGGGRAGAVGEAALVLAPTGGVHAGGGAEGEAGGAGAGSPGMGAGTRPGPGDVEAEDEGGAGLQEPGGMLRSRL